MLNNSCGTNLATEEEQNREKAAREKLRLEKNQSL